MKIAIKALIIILFFNLMYAGQVKGQYGTKFEVVPPSPNASSLGRFGEVPIGFFTGIPQIGVPLHNYKGGANGLSLNISLDYHAGGIKVADVASNVGLGWVLSGGGVISRTIYGLADFSQSVAGFHMPDTLPNGTGQINRIKGCAQWVGGVGVAAGPTDNSPCNGQPYCIESVSDFFKIVDINKGNLDGQIDVFNYSFEGYSGKFIIGKNDVILQIPETNLKISKIYNGSILQGFVVTTPTGVQYVFKELEYNNYESRRCPLSEPNPLGCPLAGTNQEIGAWYVSEIYSASQRDTISFSYEGAVLRYETNIGETYYVGPTGTPVYEKITGYHGDVGGFIPNEKRISNIKFPDKTSISFQYDQTRTRNDMKINGSPRALKKIIVTGIEYSYEYQLYHSYYSASTRMAYEAARPSDDYNYRLLLDSIKKVSSGQVLPYYSFEYNSGLPGRMSNGQDHWGFYNGVTNNTSLIPAPQNLTANRTANGSYAKCGTISKIIYPTGGSTSFEFEGNQGTTGAIGGIRILRTTDYDGVLHANDVITEYTYSESSSSQPVYNYTLSLRLPNNIDQTYNVYSSFSNQTLGQYRGSPATYQIVNASKLRGTYKLGKTVYTFSNGGRILYNGGFDPDYTKGFPFVPIQYLDWADGLPVNEKYYDDQNNPVREIIYEYDITRTKVKSPYFKSLKVGTLAGPYECNSSYCNSDCFLALIPNGVGGYTQEKDYVIYTSIAYYPYTGRSQLIKKTEKEFFANGIENVKETSYLYNSNYQLLSEEKFNNSRGEEVKVSYKYPYDFPALPVYQRMVNQNNIMPKVEQKSSLNGVQTGLVKTNYFEPYSNLFVPQTVDQQVASNPIEKRIEFLNFDNVGNILRQKKSGDADESYQWGYNGAFPVVAIQNAENSLTTTTTTGTRNGSLNMPTASNVSANFTTSTSGNIVLTAEGDPGNVYTIRYELGGPSSKSGYLCATRNATTCSYPSTVTFTGMPAGVYTLTLYHYSGSAYRSITYTYQGSQIVTTGIKEFFYQGFEEENGVATATPFAGKKYFAGDYTVPYTMPNARNYIVNYRYLDGTIWKSMTKTFTSNMTLTEGTAIDEVRVYPTDAFMTTFNYTPLIGMTSQTDPSGKNIRYIYDGFSRLKEIRDQDNNLIKNIDYQYQKPYNQ